MKRTAHTTDSKLEKPARTLRHANEQGEAADNRHTADAQNEIDNPAQAKGRPAAGGGKSNAGRDGGA